MPKQNETFAFADDPPPKPEPQKDHAQTLLDWLQRWNKPSVSTKDIRVYGPRSLRDGERALKSAQVLERHGWLVPNNPHQRDVRRWQIVRKPVVHPTVAG